MFKDQVAMLNVTMPFRTMADDVSPNLTLSPHKTTGTRAGVLIAAACDHAVEDRRFIPRNVLQQTRAAAGRSQWDSGLATASAAMSITLMSARLPASRRAAIIKAIKLRVAARLFFDDELDRQTFPACAASPTPVLQLRGRHRPIANQIHMGAGVRKPGD